MTLSIIIPTHKRAYQVVRLLESIAEQEFPYEDLQVLLISNLKDKKLRRQFSHWESVFFDFKYKELGCVGVNKARNMGIRFAGGDILYFLDDDCLLSNKNHLQNLVLEHKKHPLAMGIGGAYKALESLYGLEKFYHEHSEKWVKEFVSSKKSVSSQLIGGNASYKREVFDKGFYFDPLIVFGGSEEGFNQSLKEEGWILLYSEKLWVFHVVQLNWLSFIRKSFKQGLGSFKNRHKFNQEIKNGHNIKKDWAFLSGPFSFYPFIYAFFFKWGYFWGLSSSVKGNFLFRFFHFIFLVIKSRWYWLYGRVLLRYFGGLWYGLGWLYGRVLLRYFGGLWYGLGWLYGRVLLRYFGGLWYGLGWLYGRVLLRYFGGLWYGLGWLYGRVLLRYFGGLWYGLGWLYGRVLLRYFGGLWYGLGWLYGRVLLRYFGGLWYGLGWLYGRVLLRYFGGLWYGLGWLYGRVLLRYFGGLWYGLGWLYGRVLLRYFGGLWYGLGWLYGRVLLRYFGGLWYGLWYWVGYMVVCC